MISVVLREIPGKLLDAVNSGSATIHGGVVRDATGKILGHLEEVGFSSIQNVVPANPILAAIQVAQNARMQCDITQIKTLVGQIHGLAWANIAMTGVNLGVSLVGMYVLSEKIDFLQKHIELVANKISDLISHECRVLIRDYEALLAEMKNVSVLLQKNGLTDALEVKTNELLCRAFAFIKDGVLRYQSSEAIKIPFYLVYALITTTANLLKIYNFLRKECKIEQYVFAREMDCSFSLLLEKKFVKSLKSELMENRQKLLTGMQIDNVIDFLELSVLEAQERVKCHAELLNVIHALPEPSVALNFSKNEKQNVILVEHDRGMERI